MPSRKADAVTPEPAWRALLRTPPTHLSNASPAKPSDYLGLAVARVGLDQAAPPQFGAVVGSKLGGRHGRTQLWLVAWGAAAPPPPPPPTQLTPWVELTAGLAAHNELLRRGGEAGAAARAASEAAAGLAAAVAAAAAASAPPPRAAPPAEAAGDAGAPRPVRHRMPSVRASSPAEARLAAAAPYRPRPPPAPAPPPQPPRSHKRREPEDSSPARVHGSDDGSWGVPPPPAEPAPFRPRPAGPTVWAGRQPSSGYRGVYQARNGARPARARARTI